jgi:hypothetical protein
LIDELFSDLNESGECDWDRQRKTLNWKPRN